MCGTQWLPVVPLRAHPRPPGSGTILLEAAAERSGRACRFIAADIAAEQVVKCSANVLASGLASLAFFDVLRADARSALAPTHCTVGC